MPGCNPFSIFINRSSSTDTNLPPSAVRTTPIFSRQLAIGGLGYSSSSYRKQLSKTFADSSIESSTNRIQPIRRSGSSKSMNSGKMKSTPVLSADAAVNQSSTYSSIDQQTKKVAQSLDNLLSIELSKKSTELQIGLQYNNVDEKLTIYIKSIRNLASTIVHGQHSNCILMMFVRDRNKQTSWFQRRSLSSQRLDEDIIAGINDNNIQPDLKTKIVRRTSNLIFNELFAINLTEKSFQIGTILKFILVQIDRTNRPTIIALADLSLNTVNHIDQFTDVNVILDDYRPSIGQLQCTLNYLPTAQRICLTIIQAQAVCLSTGTIPNSYVKACLVYKGKIVDRQQSPVINASTNPQYQHMFSFELVNMESDNLVIIIVIYHQPTEQQQINCPTDHQSLQYRDGDSGIETALSTTSDDSLKSSKIRLFISDIIDLSILFEGDRSLSRALIIGRVILSSSMSNTDQSQWHKMMNNPRVPITQWHKIIP